MSETRCQVKRNKTWNASIISSGLASQRLSIHIDEHFSNERSKITASIFVPSVDFDKIALYYPELVHGETDDKWLEFNEHITMYRG